jgi:hypothetical protein
MRRWIVLGTWLLCLSFALVSSAHAEPISITGTITQSSANDFADVRLTGSNGLSVVAGIHPFANFGPSDLCWITCLPGTTFNLGTRNVSTNDIVGTATVGSETFLLGGLSSNFGLLDLNVEDAMFTLPDLAAGTDRFTIPIVMNGSLLYPFPFNELGPTRADTFSGSGFASVLVAPSTLQPGTWRVTGLEYTFASDENAPVPEPSTLLLAASGLGWLLRRHRRSVIRP